MAYTPQPGTIPYRAIAILQREPGAELPAAPICEELGTDTNIFATCMRPAREAGLVHTRKEGRLLYWRLGDGTPDLAPRPRDEDSLQGVWTAPPAEKIDPPPSVGEAEQTEFRAALWSDGDVVLYGVQETTDGGVILTREQVQVVKRLIAWSPLV